MVLSEPCRIHVCDNEGVCMRVDFATRRIGSVIEIKDGEVNDFIDAIQAAADELEADGYE